MGNSNYKSVSVDIPEGSPLMDDVKKAELKRAEAILNFNNGEPIYGSLCCRERERSSDYKVNKKIRVLLQEGRKRRVCCKCIYGRCVCKSRARNNSDVSV
jgi:hypothetical protein